MPIYTNTLRKAEETLNPKSSFLREMRLLVRVRALITHLVRVKLVHLIHLLVHPLTEVLSRHRIKLSRMYRILVICTANICRSPVGQVFLEHLLKDQKVKVDSAGTLALNGNAADTTMQELLIERGYPNITTHRSQALMPSLIQKYDLLLCMTDEHRNQVTKMSPIATGKVKLFGHWDQQAQVSDPIGGPRVEYEASVEQIEKLSKLWADKLIQLGVCA